MTLCLQKLVECSSIYTHVEYTPLNIRLYLQICEFYSQNPHILEWIMRSHNRQAFYADRTNAAVRI